MELFRFRINLALFLGIALLSGFLTQCTHMHCALEGRCVRTESGHAEGVQSRYWCGPCRSWECDDGYVMVRDDGKDRCVKKE